ncbi:hypothetical protein Tsubulata_022544, partial [Turnera subulata]
SLYPYHNIKVQGPKMIQKFCLRPLTPLINIFMITYFFLVTKRSLCADPQFLTCSPTKTCGDNQIIRFPFYIQGEQEPYCGYPGFNLSCRNGRPILKLSSDDYIVHEISYEDQSLRVSNAAVFDDLTKTCHSPIHNLSLPDDRFNFSSSKQTSLFFLYNCSSSSDTSLLKYKVDCPAGTGQELTTSSNIFAMLDDDPLLSTVSKKCGNGVAAPVERNGTENAGVRGLQSLLERGFVLNWTANNCGICHDSGGKCGFNVSTYHFRCFCPDRPHAWFCTPKKRKSHLGLGLAIGVARGLEYLHSGCNTRIVHFDIKPHNILLDEDFCPKISDFGLARLCNRKESIMSMSEARGTIGYIAPEVFLRHLGGVSHKSDVYSYGMMILEMVEGRKQDGAEAEPADATSSEKYFPYWIYKHLELGREHELHGVIAAEDTATVRKMTIVGLWCIQTIPSDRPSISKVIEMLEGPLEALTIPPQPFLSSPPRLPCYSSTASTASFSSEREKRRNM